MPTRSEFGANLARGLREAWQIARGVVGARAYEIYLEHHSRVHPGEEPMTERVFWRHHTDKGDTNPGARCC
ncbi:YbdD/YjiX family protein [Nocardiopsis sp. CT-R113]|uniref:YbdD/YjiX family protein n=1 Tax=Nocardiopsis codii TaxID=3065942 RepID=A0ABU7KA27_9ACTN|nr:YbdD/YjiX family protein [Nocardiopsis sp. CT-R113]MEE2039091.1 YbdD/YjiX family protein [Nocardiopsis sp. CT-R113]